MFFSQALPKEEKRPETPPEPGHPTSRATPGMDERKRMSEVQPRQCIAAPPGSDNLPPGATAGDGPCQAARGSQCLRSLLDGSGKRLPGTAVAAGADGSQHTNRPNDRTVARSTAGRSTPCPGR
ncbi:conserved protein of unknown function [Ectopseudomonas oleovorans]|uniref:Uncharacterized protein n=1 Tax=Ectopseudomonas oleovorans TaxID=301 RepID=A0A653BAX7_ECTOL|nr:conserved protein of unknown function [Pseudomonas oleovorans]